MIESIKERIYLVESTTISMPRRRSVCQRTRPPPISTRQVVTGMHLSIIVFATSFPFRNWRPIALLGLASVPSAPPKRRVKMSKNDSTAGRRNKKENTHGSYSR